MLNVMPSAPAHTEPEQSSSISRSRSRAMRWAWVGVTTVLVVAAACFSTTPFTLGQAAGQASAATAQPRYAQGNLNAHLLPPSWAPHSDDEQARRDELNQTTPVTEQPSPPSLSQGEREPEPLRPTPPPNGEGAAMTDGGFLGTDRLGRPLLIRCLLGGAISLAIGLAAAFMSVGIGTAYGMVAGFAGGRVDAAMMRLVDILYGLPYLLLVVLLAVAGDAMIDRLAGGPGTLTGSARRWLEVAILLFAISSISWLTLARVVRGQVLSLKAQPFVEAAKATGTPPLRTLVVHILPNLTGPIVVYATFAIPGAILQESFLSFLGIGVPAPLPSWGQLAAEGLRELNPVRVRWWLVLFPCGLLGITLLALNIAGEGLREAFDPRGGVR